jgi:hypothetical protein
MTINVLRRRGRGVLARRQSEPLAIGEPDRDVFSCPSCSRPLAVGTSRCSGCNAVLVLGVRAKMAGLLLIIGLAFGVLGGGMITASYLTMTRVAPASAAPPVAATAAPAAAGAAPGSDDGVTGPAVDPVSIPAGLSAVRQATLINTRLADAGLRMEAALSAPAADTSEIVKALRSVATDATFGVDLASRIATWEPGAAVGADLAAAYGEAVESAREALRAPLKDRAAYLAAAERMLVLLDGIAALDGTARSIGAR